MSAAYDVFLSHDHRDAAWVEELGHTLETEHGFKVWLDKWVLVPGESWQQAMAKGLTETTTCAVVLGPNGAQGWFQQEIERALNMQAAKSSYRVIPVLMPRLPASMVDDIMPAFLELRTWVDFREGQDVDYAMHLLVHGVTGTPPGPWPPRAGPVAPGSGATLDDIERDLHDLERYKPLLHETVVLEYERRILSRRFPPA
jgi:hypothetical protein